MYQTDKRGLLIVSTLNEKDLPGYFAKQFEVIDFNPKQAQPTEKTCQQTHKPNQKTPPTEIYYDDNKGMLFVKNNSIKLTPIEKTFFECFWNKGEKGESVSVDDVIDYMTTLNESKGTTWDIGYFNKTKSMINKKCKVLGITELIHNVAEKENKLSTKVKKKIFKS